MMDFNVLIRKYWEENKESIDFGYVATYNIIMTVFKGIHEVITKDTFDIVRIKYLGLFKPGYYKMLLSCESNIKRYKNELMGEEKFEYLMTPLIKFFCHNHSKISFKKRYRLLEVIKFCKKYKDGKINNNK